MARRVYWESLKKWANDNKKKLTGVGSAGGVITIMFLFLSMSGAIDITGFSGDEVCFGTEKDPCEAIVNFTANEDIFIYKTDYDPWGRNVSLIGFDPAVKDWKMYRSWGSGWREIPLDEGCTGTWCGKSPGDDRERADFAIAFREGKDYTIKIEATKEHPQDEIRWSLGGLEDEVQ